MTLNSVGLTCDVAVVGAGLAGLAAADSLAGRGVKVLVFEAGAEVGGRVRTHREPDGTHFELGAFSFDESQTTLWGLVRRLGLTLIQHSQIDREFIFEGSQGRFSDDASSLFSSNLKLTFNELLAACFGRVPSGAEDRSLAESLHKAGVPDKVIQWLENHSLPGLSGEGFGSLSTQRMLEYFRQYRDSKSFHAVKGGNDQIPKTLAQRHPGKIFCNFPIVKIERVAQQWLLHSKEKSVSANHIIFAIPPPAFRAIAITPPLSDSKRQAMEAIRYTSCTRISVVAPPGHLKEVRGGVFASSDGWLRDQTAFQQAPTPATVLNQSFVGEKARDVKQMSPQECQRYFLEEIRKFIPDFRGDSIKTHLHSWDDVKWIGGGYAYFPPHTFCFKKELAKPEGSLFFCGEHTSDKPASMNGALESGLRAADELLLLTENVRRANRGEIVTIDSIREMEEYLPPEGIVLVVCDLDDTFIVLENSIFQIANFRDQFPADFKATMSEFNLKEQALAFTLPLLTTPAKLIEPDSPKSIERMQARPNTRVVALTAAMGWGLKGLTIEDTRIQGLADVDIHFSKSFTDMPSERTISGDFEDLTIGRRPFFKDGVIFTNNQKKGLVLDNFLETLPSLPNCIVVVDDKKEHLENIKDAMKKYPQIKVIALHYKTNPNIYGQTDVETFKRQWKRMGYLARKILNENTPRPRL